MRHEITVQSKTFRLRPVTIEDVGFITRLRSNPNLTRFLYPPSTNISEQIQWLNSYFERKGDYYFIVEQVGTAQAEGTVAIYDLDSTRKCAQWGRWFIRPESMGAVESAFLVYRAAFEVLELDMLYCRVVIENTQVVLFHKLFGLVPYANLTNHWHAGDVSFNVIEFRMTREAWEERKAALENKTSLIAKLYSRDD